MRAPGPRQEYDSRRQRGRYSDCQRDAKARLGEAEDNEQKSHTYHAEAGAQTARAQFASYFLGRFFNPHIIQRI
jgi:hypothetical protein